MFTKTASAARWALIVAAFGAASVIGNGIAATTPTQPQQGKVTVCHRTHSRSNPKVTITISRKALPKHLAHGDTIGACATSQAQSITTQNPPTTEKPKPTRGSSTSKASKSYGRGQAHGRTK